MYSRSQWLKSDLVTVLLELCKKSCSAFVREDCRDVGESVVRQFAVLWLPSSSNQAFRLTVVSRTWAKAMTGLHCWAKVRLLRVSRSLQDTKVSWGIFHQKYLIQSPLAPLGHRSTCRDRRRGSWTSRKRFLGGKLSWGWCWGLVVAPLHSLFGSKASKRCRRYCCSHLVMIHYGRVE